jgi:hypothetical protein
VSAFSDNLQEIDVGTPIDEIIKPLLKVVPAPNPISLYVQKLGQFWLIFGTFAYVYSYSRTAQIAAWTRYTFQFNIDAAAEFQGDVYVRNADNVYVLDATVFQDAGFAIPVVVEMPFQDMGLPGVNKNIVGNDMISTGTQAQIAYRWDSRHPTELTVPYTMVGDTEQGPQYPVELVSVRAAPVITHSANEDFQLHQLMIYWDRSDGQG